MSLGHKHQPSKAPTPPDVPDRKPGPAFFGDDAGTIPDLGPPPNLSEPIPGSRPADIEREVNAARDRHGASKERYARPGERSDPTPAFKLGAPPPDGPQRGGPVSK